MCVEDHPICVPRAVASHGICAGIGPLSCVWVRIIARRYNYEGRQGFQVYPESGSVHFGGQWAVSYCDRIGRDLIRLEIKKLYEGVPAEITRHWHKFAAEPPPDTSYEAVAASRHVAGRARALTYGMANLAENLAMLSDSMGMSPQAADTFFALRKEKLDYSGWWTFDAAEVVSRQIPRDMTLDTFLDRCLSLTKLLVEGLKEPPIRNIVRAAGVPEKDAKGYRTLKLLDCVVRLKQVAAATGLFLKANDPTVWERLVADGTDPPQPIGHLFALYDLRLQKAHAGSKAAEITKILARFGINEGETAAGFGLVLDKVYDRLIDELNHVNKVLTGAL